MRYRLGLPRPVLLVACIGVSVLAAACGSSSKHPAVSGSGGSATTGLSGTSGNAASAARVTANAIKIGLVASFTGNSASAEAGAQYGVLARFQAQNAQGGVDGRKLELVQVDDQSSFSGDQTAVQDLVSKGVFGVISATPYLGTSYRILQQRGIPVTGLAVDGPEWGIAPNTNMFSIQGGLDPKYPANTQFGNFFKSIGAQSVGGLAYGINPSSQDSIKDLKESVEAVGLKMAYENLTLPFGGVEFTSYILAMKQAGVDAVACSCVQSSNIALITAAKQGGLALKADLSFSGADSTVFASPTAALAAQGSYFTTDIPPIDLNKPATNTFMANLKAVDSSYQVGTYPTFGAQTAYESADLMIRGLQAAGQNPTRQAFISGLTAVTNYDAGGLLATPVAFNHFGSANPTTCSWFVQVKGNTFVTINNGKPICGSLIRNSDVAS